MAEWRNAPCAWSQSGRTRSAFPHARQVVALTAERTIKRTGETSVETRYHVTSRPAEDASPRALLTAIRDHWAGIENRSHWRRDALWERIAAAHAVPTSPPTSPCCA